MFDPRSRYVTLPTAEYKMSDGRKIAYQRRRFLPQGETRFSLTRLTVTQDDRLDLITNETLGDPEQFWQICDANNAMNPFLLISDPVQEIRIPQ
ncbi:MAG: hypothetical protein VKJ24_15555 [Synechococcales bacterium]|nr:hypothetical protein [Synechococcales bacterium]